MRGWKHALHIPCALRLKAPRTLWWASWKWTCVSCKSSVSEYTPDKLEKEREEAHSLLCCFGIGTRLQQKFRAVNRKLGDSWRGIQCKRLASFSVFAIVPLCSQLFSGDCFRQITLLQRVGCRGAFCKMPKHLRAKCFRVNPCNAYHKLLLLDGIRWG